MNLNNYIKTENIVIIQSFIKLCKDRNILIDPHMEEDWEQSDKIYGVGIFTRDPGETGVVVTNANDILLNFSVCVITDEKPASWWNKLRLDDYESFIKSFDVGELKDFLGKKLEKTKKDFPQFTIGCEMIGVIDLEYGFYKENWDPYILKGYHYSSVSSEWKPRTQKGYGDFEGFRIWTKDILDMDKKQIKKLYK